jgi:SpoU rRNA methylase family enzyme
LNYPWIIFCKIPWIWQHKAISSVRINSPPFWVGTKTLNFKSTSVLVSVVVPKAANSVVKVFKSAFKVLTLSLFFAFLDNAISSFKDLIWLFKDSILPIKIEKNGASCIHYQEE